MGKKRAQITVFIILGIVIFAVFAFILRVSSQVEKLKLEKQAEEVTAGIEQSSAIQHYIKICLKESAEEALIKIGEQGGRIYDYQGGNSPIGSTSYIQLYIENKTINVSVGLLAPKLRPPFNFSPFLNVPWYPEEFEGHAKIDHSKYYYLGEKELPFLCDLSGPNMFNASKTFTWASCMPRNAWYWGTSPDTLQIQLQDYASKLLADCVDPEYIREYTGYNITVGTPNTTAIYGENDITFKSSFPVEIIFPSPSKLSSKPVPIKRQIAFTASLPVRIKRVYDLAIDIIDSDRSKTDFDFELDYPLKESFIWLNKSVNLNDTQIEIEVFPVQDQKADAFVITDYGSVIRGGPFVFQFLRMNRPPILDYIHQTPLDSSYDILAAEQTLIEIKPKAYDPDEDYYDDKDSYPPPNCIDDYSNRCMDYNYSYSGWMETDYYFFNYTCCLGLAKVENCLNDTSKGGCVQRNYTKKPFNWSNSSPYKTTFRDSRYLTSKSDIGYHLLNVTICDEHMACDWQQLKIAVYDLPKPVANGANFYPDLNRTLASDEDPYILDATHSFVIVPIITPSIMPPYRWCDNVEFPNCYDFLVPNATLPKDTFNIHNITALGMNFYDYGKYLIPPKKSRIHTLNLTLGGSTIYSDEMNVTVFQCLPHRNNSPSYPYNSFSDDPYPDVNDPFQANHTCCQGTGKNPGASPWGEVFPKNTPCYSFVEYGTKLSFTSSHLEKTYNPNVNMSPNFDPASIIYSSLIIQRPIISQDGLISLHYNNTNDIIVRTFTRLCDGTRGNICNGTIIDNITVKTCDDKYLRRCQGPSRSDFPNLNDIKQNPSTQPSCANYEDETFEYIFTSPANDHLKVCNETSRCSDPSSKTGFGIAANPAVSHFVCNATCDGNGGCAKPIECFDCFSLNTCIDPDGNDITIKGSVTGNNYTACTGSTCSNPSYVLHDRCLAGAGQILQEYLCQQDPRNRDDPYYITNIDCSKDPKTKAICKYNDALDQYQERKPGKCNDGKCVAESFTNCQDGYGCSSKSGSEACTLQEKCEFDSDCNTNKGYHCVESKGRCAMGAPGDFCDSNDDCILKYCAGTGAAIKCTTGEEGELCDDNSDCNSAKRIFCVAAGGNKRCYDGSFGDPCNTETDCQSGSCNSNTKKCA